MIEKTGISVPRLPSITNLAVAVFKDH